METIENTHIESGKKIGEILRVPFLICDQKADILYANAGANDLFKVNLNQRNLFELINTADHQRINQLFSDAERSQRALKELMTIRTTSGQVLKSEFQISAIQQEYGSHLFMLVIDQDFFQTSEQASVRLSLPGEELEKIVHNKRIFEIIEEIRSSFPFTFLGKNKIQQEINKIEELFWLKDSSDAYVIVNDKFAKSLGFRTNQLEGKLERNFLPIYYLEFYRTIENYIKETLNCMVIEGIPLRGFAATRDFQTIEIPLIDAENNILAIIGISQKKKSTYDDQASSSLKNEEISFQKFPMIAARFNSENKLEDLTPMFRKFFPEITIGEVSLSELFLGDDRHKVERFLSSEKEQYHIEAKLAFSKTESSVYSCDLRKILSRDGESVKYYLFIEKEFNFDNLEDLLKKKGRMFDILIQNNPDPIFIYDAENLRFLEVNNAALQLYGYRREEFLQMDLTDLYSPEDIQTLLENNQADDKITKLVGPYKHKKHDGSAVLVEIYKTLFMYENKPAHFNVVKDITVELEKRKELKLLQSTIEHTSDLLFTTDVNGFIKETNSAVLQYLNVTKQEIKDSSIISLFTDDLRGEINLKIFYNQSKEVITTGGKIKNPNGDYDEVTIKAIPIVDHTEDITAYQILITVLPKSREVIKEVVKEVVVEKEVFVEKPDKGETITKPGESVSLDGAQISGIFHEILTPINVILGFVQELKDGIKSPTEEQKEALEYIDQNRENLLEIMNSISEYAVIQGELKELVPDEIRVADIIDTFIKEESEYFQRINRTLVPGKISGSLTVYSDKKKLTSFLGIFLKVVAHITREEKVYISTAQVDDFNYLISVKDGSVKISDHLLETFLDVFNTKGSINPKTFHVSKYSIKSLKSLLEALRGTIEIVQRSGKPAELGFILPLNLFEERSSTDVAIPQTDEFTNSSSEVSENEYAQVQPYSSFKQTSEFTFTEEPQFDEEEFTPANSQFEFKTNFVDEESFDSVNAEPEIEDIPKFEYKKPSVNESRKLKPIPEETPLNKEFRSMPVVSKQQFPQQEQPKTKKSTTPFTSNPVVQPQMTKAAPAVEKQKPATSIKTPEPVFPPPPQKKVLELANYNCLYIEDQVDSQILFKVQMKELREIKFAVSFEEALPLLTGQVFDFIVMDINLQGEYNGLDALKMIRQMLGLQHIPVIAVTAYVLPGDREKFIAAGFNDFISKPIFREKMIDSLEKIMLLS